MKLLHIDSSITGDASTSRHLSREIVARWRAEVPGLEVSYVDLAANPLPHLSGASLAKDNNIEAARNAAVLEQFLAADVVVIGAPMYNFTLPTQLKGWIDRILVAGRTFRYTERGPQGLVGSKRVIVAVSQGNVYGPDHPGEHVESYLRFVFGFMGITDVTFVRAEGIAISAERRQKAIDGALATIQSTVALAA